MTQDERQMLSNLADKIAKTPPPPRDPEAEEFIRTRIGNRPDALYLMTQTVLIQNIALEQAQQQLRAQQGSGGGSGSFLGQQASSAQQPTYGNPPGYGNQSYGNQQYAAPQMPNAGGQQPSFLRGAAQTAAGVAAGALAFEGIRSLFSHPGYGEYGQGFGGSGFGGPAEETVVNNYYDSPNDSDRFSNDGGNDNLQLQDARDDFSGGDAFDSSGDDSGGFDDGGGGFDDNFS